MTLPSTLRKKQSLSFPSSLRKKELIQNDEEQDFDLEREEERARAQLTSRGLEAFLGAPGDIASFVSGLFGKEQNILPTSSKLREFSEKASLGYTKPKSEFEESIGDIVSDVGSMAFPGGGHYSFARNIGIPIVGNLVKEGIKYGNGKEKSQAYGKTGTLVALDLISRNKGGVKKYVNSLFQKADEAIPKGVSINAENLGKSLNKLEETLTAGGVRTTTKKALEKITEIKNEIKNGKIDAKRLAAYRPSINEAIEELGGFQLEIPKKLKPQAIRNLNEVKSNVIKSLNEYGEKFNPDFAKFSREANEGYAALKKSEFITNFIQDKVGFQPKSKAVQVLFSYGPTAAGVGALALSPMSALSGTAAYGGYNAFKVLHRTMNSPVLRKYYLNVLKEASAGNVAETSKNLKKLDEVSLLNDIDQDQNHQKIPSQLPKTLQVKRQK